MSFEIVESISEERGKIERAIRKYGFDPEQNYGYFHAHHTKEEPAVFITDGDRGIPATYNKETKCWIGVGTPLAPKEEQVEFLLDAMQYLKKRGMIADFVTEFETAQKREAYEKFAHHFKVRRPSCTLYWPVFDMRQWTGDKLKGKEWKKIRNYRNRFLRSHKVKIVDTVTLSKEEVKGIVERWVKFRAQTGYGVNRKDSNRTDYDHYMNMVDLSFEGFDNAKSVVVDGKAVSITGGWKIPRSDTYYSAVGIYDLSVPDLGEFVNWSDLVLLKKQGHKFVDFGGSPKPLLQFKRKFKPHRQYTTYIFTVSNP